MRGGASRRRSGFTLPEAVMALVLLGIAAAGVLLPFSGGASVHAEGQRLTLAAKLAHDLLAQVLITAPAQVISTWNGYVETTGNIKDAGGAVFTDSLYDGFSRSVTCAEVCVPQESGLLAPNFIMVTVQVDWQGRTVGTVRHLVSK